jgi:hypothetical protein
MNGSKAKKNNEKNLKDAQDKKSAAAERAWKRGFQTTTEKDILDAGRKD